ncbi:hypothetical protein ZHAS_00011357 [Anopheles sinensis]|uniref:Uncharacterized protein n=1 Tax=Anopheles sinensis TaxID=74873 RepID=A0A084W001_ANOSI|nr:hypothetical protein ZHAS_00011357 [Anopheles sinensis]
MSEFSCEIDAIAKIIAQFAAVLLKCSQHGNTTDKSKRLDRPNSPINLSDDKPMHGFQPGAVVKTAIRKKSNSPVRREGKIPDFLPFRVSIDRETKYRSKNQRTKNQTVDREQEESWSSLADGYDAGNESTEQNSSGATWWQTLKNGHG